MFFKCETVEEAKTLFKRLAKRLHPDLGGDHDLMILLQEAHNDCIGWISISKTWKTPPSKKAKEKTKKKSKEKVKPEPEPKKESPPWDGIYTKVTEDVFRGDPRLLIINEILAYSIKNPSFKTDFTESIRGFLDKKDYITSSQYNTLVKIYFSFRMDEEEDEEELKT